MSIGHTFRESKFFKNVAGLFLFHSDGVGALDRVIFLSLLIKSNFTNNPCSQFGKDFGNALSDVFSTSVRVSLDFISNRVGSFNLCFGKLLDSLGVTSETLVNKS